MCVSIPRSGSPWCTVGDLNSKNSRKSYWHISVTELSGILLQKIRNKLLLLYIVIIIPTFEKR